MEQRKKNSESLLSFSFLDKIYKRKITFYFLSQKEVEKGFYSNPFFFLLSIEP